MDRHEPVGSAAISTRQFIALLITVSLVLVASVAVARDLTKADIRNAITLCGAGIKGSDLEGKIAIGFEGFTPTAVLEGAYKERLETVIFSEPSISSGDKVRLYDRYRDCFEEHLKKVTKRYPAIRFVDKVGESGTWGTTSLANFFNKYFVEYELRYENRGSENIACSILLGLGIKRRDGSIDSVAGDNERHTFYLNAGENSSVEGEFKTNQALSPGEKYTLIKNLSCWSKTDSWVPDFIRKLFE